MSDYILPVTPSLGNYGFGTTLQGTQYNFAFRWNARDNGGAWYFSVYDVANNPIKTGIKVVLGAYLGCTCLDPLFTQGVFVAVDMSNDELDPGFDDFGTRVLFKYVPVLDLLTRRVDTTGGFSTPDATASVTDG